MARHNQQELPATQVGGIFVGAEIEKAGESAALGVEVLLPENDGDVLTGVDGKWASSPLAGGGGASHLILSHDPADTAGVNLTAGADRYPLLIADATVGDDLTLDADQQTIHVLTAGLYEVALVYLITHSGTLPERLILYMDGFTSIGETLRSTPFPPDPGGDVTKGGQLDSCVAVGKVAAAQTWQFNWQITGQAATGILKSLIVRKVSALS